VILNLVFQSAQINGMEQLDKIAEKIDSLSLRERAIVFIGIIAVIFTVWDYFLFTPIEAEQKKIITKLNEKNAERLVLINRFQALMKSSQEDPNAANIAKLKKLRSHLIDLQADLELSTGNLVSAKDMPKILETVLHKVGGLTLRNFKSLGVTPIVAKEEAETTTTVSNDNNSDDNKKLTANNIDNAYKHGLRIEITGDYLTTLDYLKSLEELEWGFYWDNFKLTVNEYPEANVAIEIFTLSLNKEWIGV
jgi:MSHA biogenesis protein MshJ